MGKDQGELTVITKASHSNHADEFSTMEFGNYYQSSQDSKEPIEWIILEERGNSLLLLSKYALDCRPYNTKRGATSWETCTLRKWLNDSFLEEAFSLDEQKMINTTKVTADENPQYNTSTGNDTNDKVFLLSIAEADRYFSSNDSRILQVTAYCFFQGAFKADNGNCLWWLRTPGRSTFNASNVDNDGCIFSHGDLVNCNGVTVRPALWVTLE